MSAHVVWRDDGHIGREYDRLIAAGGEWTTLIDHDVLLVNPHWAHILARVAHAYPQAGIITCWTNRIGKTEQRDKDAPQCDDITQHREHARRVWHRYGYHATDIDKASGMLMHVRRQAWADAGGCSQTGLFRVDWQLSRDIAARGWRILRADGLYCYHARVREPAWIEGCQTTDDRDRAR
jgi:hypothetical protein